MVPALMFLNAAWCPDLVVPDLQSCHIFRMTLQTAPLRVPLKLSYFISSSSFIMIRFLFFFFIPVLLYRFRKINKYPNKRHSWKVGVRGATPAIKSVCRAQFPASRHGGGISLILISDVCKLFKSVLVTQFSLYIESSLQIPIHSLASRFNFIKGLYNPVRN